MLFCEYCHIYRWVQNSFIPFVKDCLVQPLCRHLMPVALSKYCYSLSHCRLVLLRLSHKWRHALFNLLRLAFFHSTQCLWDPPKLLSIDNVFLCVAEWYSAVWVLQFVHPFTHWKTFELFPDLAITRAATINSWCNAFRVSRNFHICTAKYWGAGFWVRGWIHI